MSNVPRWFNVTIRNGQIDSVSVYHLDPMDPEGLFRKHIADSYVMKEDPFPRYEQEVLKNGRRTMSYIFLSEGLMEACALATELEKVRK